MVIIMITMRFRCGARYPRLRPGSANPKIDIHLATDALVMNISACCSSNFLHARDGCFMPLLFLATAKTMLMTTPHARG